MSLNKIALPNARNRIVFFLIVLVFSGAVLFLTYNFIRDHFNDASWFQYGSYRVFDKRAQDILDGRGRLFWIDDPTRTDLVQYPPAYPWMVAVIYWVTGERSAYAVQKVLAVLDWLLSLTLITGIAVTAYGWRAGMIARSEEH